MILQQATNVRKEWSAVCDSVVREKPVFVKRTRDRICISSLSTMLDILSLYQFTALKFTEDDGSVTLSLNEIDLAENGKDESEARQKLAESILEYANEYYENFELYSHAPNRKMHLPYIMKAYILDNIHEIGNMIICQVGKN